MSESTQTSAPDETFPRWRARLVEGRWILLAAALVLAVMAFASDLAWWHALLGFVMVALAALFVPRKSPAERTRANNGDLPLQLRLESVLSFADTLPDPCFLLDRRSVVVHRNGEAADQFPGIRVGQPLAFTLRNPTLIAAIDRVRNTGAPESVEVQQSVPNETWYHVFVAPLNVTARDDDDPRPERVVVTMHNLTEQKRVDSMRVDFVANASHELRTPLTSLIGFIETLQGPAARDAEARERFLGIMRGQAERMSKLIDDLLSLSRIELRQHVRPTTEVDVSAILREVVEGLQTQAQEVGTAVDVRVPEDGVAIRGERDEVYEVFENLVENAIKYGGDGGSVSVTLGPASRAGFDYKVAIADKGPGIPAEHVPRLTERFYRVDAESSRKKKGTGLGLAIVKHILNRHNAEMTIRSTVGEGTTVEILLRR